MRLKPAEHLYSLQALYVNYDITGPFSAYSAYGQENLGEKYVYDKERFSINYLVFTSKSDPEAIFYQAYEYSVWENHNGKKLRPNQRIEFKKYAFNYARTNLKSVIAPLPEGEIHPMRGYGCFASVEALAAVYNLKLNIFDGGRVIGNSEPRQPPEPTRSYRRTLPDGMVVPKEVLCMCCGLPLKLTRNRRYLYIYKNKRSFLHTECVESFLAMQRASALAVRRERSLLRKQGDFIPIRVVSYTAKPMLNYREASSHDKDYFEAHYKDVGKDYIPAQILKVAEDLIPLGASEVLITATTKRCLNIKDALHTHMQGPNYILFHRVDVRGKSVAKEFVHVSW